jgi:hypothetical protein
MLEEYRVRFLDARHALSLTKAQQAVNIAGPLLEDILSYITERLDPPRHVAQQRPTLGSFVKLFRDSETFDDLERVTGRSASVLRTLDLSTCLSIRNRATHSDAGSAVSTDEARFLITTVENYLSFLGVDVDLVVPHRDEMPFRFVDNDGCLQALLERIWQYPEAGGSRRSWAVKESSVLRGELRKAFAQPGLGIALFTTELATEVFGAKVNKKIKACIDWGVSQTTESSLLLEETDYRITGRVTTNLDLRHSVALAILMARAGTNRNHVERYLKIVLESRCNDGGWPDEFGGTKSDLPTTVYVLEFLSLMSRRSSSVGEDLHAGIHDGQQSLIRDAKPQGGWATGIFATKNWDRVWSTSYLIQRLFAAQLHPRTDWSKTLVEAIECILRDATGLKCENEETQLRVEARVAADLAWSLRDMTLEPILQERIGSWLNEWECRFLQSLRVLPSKICDLATATFAARALLRTRNYRELGNQILAETE